MPDSHCQSWALNGINNECETRLHLAGLLKHGVSEAVKSAVPNAPAWTCPGPMKWSLPAFCAATILMVSGPAALVFGGEFSFDNCHARWSDTNLIIGNAHLERQWQIRDGLLTATSFRDLDAGVEWLAKPAGHPAPVPPGKVVSEHRAVSISAKGGRFSPVEAQSLVLEMAAAGRRQSFHYRFQLFPEARGVAMEFASTGGPTETNRVMGKESEEVPTGANEQATRPADQADGGDALENLWLAPQHLRFTQVTFADQTDIHNELVSEREWLLMKNEQTILVPGNVFYCENVLTSDGLIFLKQAPLPGARPVKSEWDMAVNANARQFQLAGQGYPFVVLAYRGGRNGRIETLQDYRQVRVVAPRRDGMFLSNTWGDRSRDARINEAFMEKEIAAGHRLGVDVVQIDDGWQKGRSVNSASSQGGKLKFWEADPRFWDIDQQRFPEGLDKLVHLARAKGMQFGLWYAPDSVLEFTNWQRDASRVLELWRQHGIEYFKFDMIMVSSPSAESNLHHLFDRIREESKGKIVIDLDVTAGIRPGYFGALETGPIFVENRYTDFHRYWPHQTLRNLWQLSQYVDPLRLRMEFLNNTRNPNLYAGDPLAPAAYAPDCLFATVMVANPLGWFETSSLPEDYIQPVAGLVEIWKQERDKLHSEKIIPIGSVPDGVTWTGFASVAQDRRSGSLLLFRELNESPQWVADLSMFTNGLNHATVLAGNGSVEMEHGKLKVSIPKPLQYLWVRMESNGP